MLSSDRFMLYYVQKDKTMCNNINVPLDLGYHGYVIKLSNIKVSPSKVKYFRATMHDGTNEKSVLSYNHTLHAVMNSAQLTDKPVLNFIEKIDEFNDKPLLTLANQSTVEYSKENIPFTKVYW